jgi:hypothetical protein
VIGLKFNVRKASKFTKEEHSYHLNGELSNRAGPHLRNSYEHEMISSTSECSIF